MIKRVDPAATTAASESRDEQLAEILDRYLCSLEHDGAPPDVEVLAAEHPELADEIRAHVESLHLLHQIGRDDNLTSSTRLPPSAKRLGDFELVREIGRGGMGIVYEARQLSLNRPVALKVLPFAAILDEQHISRFKIEAQAAAQLHHPNIVPVYAVGQERGVHFFAMQLIEGQSLEAAIEQLRESRRPNGGVAPTASDETLPEGGFSTAVSTNSRRYCQSVARLGVQAAVALHHAHEYGVVHRDVKPSNLLVDRASVLWVTDFGLARMQAGSTCLTAPGHVIGTARYMSPEQASGQQALVDAASDVYSLGATLYELLTLEHCHRGNDRQELQTAIAEHDPLPPRRINRAVPVELETIVLHALEKSRSDRYATARELADDLQRFLDGRPIAAHRPTFVDRAVRWALRRRRSVAAAVAMLCIVVATLGVAAWRISAEQRRTVAQQQRTAEALAAAREHFGQARLVVDRFNDDVADQLAELPGASPLRRALLGESLHYYEQFMQHAADDPTLRYDVASAAFQAGAAAEQLGDYSQAEELYGRADRLFVELARDQPGDARLPPHLAKCLNKLGLLRSANGDMQVARNYYEQAINALSGADADDALAETYANLGLLEHRLGDAAAAVDRLEEASRLLGAPSADETADRKRRHKLAIIANNLSFVLHDVDLPRAVVVNEQARNLLTRLLDDAPHALQYRSDLAASWTNYGAICGREGNWADAAAAHQRAVELTRQLLRQAPGVVRHRRDLVVSLSNVGEAHCRNRADAAAQQSLVEAIALARNLVDDFPSAPGLQDLLAGVLNNYASALETAGQLHQALSAYAEAVDVQQRIVAAAPARADQGRLSTQYLNYSRALRSAGQNREAERILQIRNNLIAQLQIHRPPADAPDIQAQTKSKP